MYAVFLFSLLLNWVLVPEGKGSDDLPFTEPLDLAENVLLRWGFEEFNNDITFELTVETTGWIGLGFSPNGGMAGADIAIGGVAPNGSTYFRDYHAVGNSMPLVDKQQSYTLLSLTEDDGRTSMKFRRPMRTCDEEDFTISASPVKLIYAFGLTDEIEYHEGRRGTKQLNLLKYMPRSNPPESSFFDITAINFTIPPVDTWYHCWVVKIPTLGKKHHIYRIEPIIKNINIVHHILLYECHPRVNETAEGACYTTLALSSDCQKVIAAWAIGGTEIDLPEVAGLPIGGENDASYYRLEIHYDNPEKIKDRIDDSGLRFHYTAALRQYDAAIMDFGLMVEDEYFIPPQAPAFKSYAVCNTAKFAEVMEDPMPDLKVFLSALHTHLTGRMIRVGHFRNGTQIDFLDLDENYDFNLQQGRLLGKIKTIKKGDDIIVECTYDTRDRPSGTTLGLSTREEMCFVFMFYYPAINIGSCWSIPDMREMRASFGVQNNKEARIMYDSMTWDNDTIENYQNGLKKSSQFLMIASQQKVKFFNAHIRDLNATPSVSCRSAVSEGGGNTGNTGNTIVRFPHEYMMLLWLATVYFL